MRIPDELTIGYDEIERVLLKEANTIYKQCMVCLEHHSNILPELTQTDTIPEVQEIRIVLCCEASEKFVTAIFSEKCASKLENNKDSNELRSKEDIQKSESHDLAGNKINYCHLCKDQLMDKILFKFPFPPSKSDILTISRGDMDRLEPGCYLNDIIIDYYLRRLLRNQYATNAALQNAVFLLSTHFYAMLRAKTSSTSSKEKYSGYENVKTWNNLNKLFKSSLVFVPIHENLHWSLAIIVNPILAALESNDDGPQTWIILLDPLEEYHKKSTILQNLRKQWEQSGTLDTPYNTGRVKLAHLNAPLQDNYYDCGVYVIKYAEVILQNTVHILKDVNEHSDSGVISKSQLEKLIFADAFSPNDVDEMRRKIRDAMASDMLVYRQLIETR
ncbi:unnamed protein product [Albugo candida]|uniref:Ubiquitin-like protease family profile domain-containing protein n=1 Tax=Albugo candida TaxID=65357 RepID=A0A024GKJ7_9STRA|nr:unnamed protein product [Albugo candida]|eukprot:CCI47293.1 unnamed protein product [Albugo candida]